MNNAIRVSQVAVSTPFNNATNGFTATNVQAAIEEAKNSLSYYTATGTSTLTRTAGTFTTVASMTHTPIAGTYLAIWSAQVRTGNASGQGEVAIFVGATQQTALTHQTELEVTIVLGLFGVANLTEGGGSIIGVVTANGTDAVTVQYRSVDRQTVTITNRSFTLLRIG